MDFIHGIDYNKYVTETEQKKMGKKRKKRVIGRERNELMHRFCVSCPAKLCRNRQMHPKSSGTLAKSFSCSVVICFSFYDKIYIYCIIILLLFFCCGGGYLCANGIFFSHNSSFLSIFKGCDTPSNAKGSYHSGTAVSGEG